MLMPSITLPTGPFDWHPEMLPLAEFKTRLKRFRRAMSEHGVTQAVVHGNGFDHGALAWLTGFTPKLGPAYALIATNGAPRLLFAGGPGMGPSAERLTWLDDVVALKRLDGDIRKWLEETGGAQPPRLGLVEGRAMALKPWTVINQITDGASIELDQPIDALRRSKSPAEMLLVRNAAATLKAAADRLTDQLATGCPIRQACISAEQSGRQAGAQDVRIRIARRAWGKPVTAPDDDRTVTAPIPVALACRYAGFWAVGQFVVGNLSAQEHRKIGKAMAACLAELRPGAALTPVNVAMEPSLRVTFHGVGLSLEEMPVMADELTLQTGDVCSASILFRHTADATAEWSSLVAITAEGAEVLWTPTGEKDCN